MRGYSVFAVTMASITVIGCNTVPPLEHATSGIPVEAIVDRVKCEIADSFDMRTNDPYFQWMSSWGAKVDLTLMANDQGGITPIGAYIDPLPNGTAHVGSSALVFPQQFSLGAGATYNAQALRTETISFSLSLAEIKLWREGKLGDTSDAVAGKCGYGGNTDLNGGLGLKEWIDASLLPVSLGGLQAGEHPSPITAKQTPTVATKASPNPPEGRPSVALSSAKAIAAAARAKSQLDALNNEATEALSIRKKVSNAAQAADKSVILNVAFRRAVDAYAKKAESQAREIITLQDEVKQNYQDAKDAADDAETLADFVKLHPEKEKDNEQRALNYANQAIQGADDAETSGLKAKALIAAAKSNASLASKQPDPPIDSLAHSVQFVVTWGANVTPSWTLVKWRGPTGTFASATGTTTHTLNIAFGPTSEQNRLLNNLVLQQLRLQ